MAVRTINDIAADQSLWVTGIGDAIQCQVWHSVRQRAIIPAWHLCRDRLRKSGRKAYVQDRSDTGEMLAALFWRGRDALAGHLIGLQFSPIDGGGTLRFDLSVVRDNAGCRYQASLYREHFQIAEADLVARVARGCAFAMGVASATERSPLNSVVWKQRMLRPKRLC